MFLIYAFSTYEEMDVLLAYFGLAIGAYVLGAFFLITWSINKYRVTRKKVSSQMALAILWLCLPLFIFGFFHIEREMKQLVIERRVPSEEIITKSIQQAGEHIFDGIVHLNEDVYMYDEEKKHLKVMIHINKTRLVDHYNHIRTEIEYEAVERNLEGNAQKQFLNEHVSVEMKKSLNRFFTSINRNIWSTTHKPNKITIIGYVDDVQIYQSSTNNEGVHLNDVDYIVIEENDSVKLTWSNKGRLKQLTLID